MVGDISIRRVSSADANAVAGLVSALGYPTSAPAARRRLLLLDRPDYVTFVACQDSNVIGLAGAFAHLSLEYDEPFARVTGLVVQAEWRGQGVGRALMLQLEEWARAQGAIALTLTSGNQRQEAHAFYKHLGYGHTGVRFVKFLSPSVGASGFCPEAVPGNAGSES